MTPPPVSLSLPIESPSRAAFCEGGALRRPNRVLLGVGNVLRGDEGVGVEVAARAARRAPPEVEVCDGGTAGLDLAGVLEGRERVVVVDAVDAGGPAGTIYRFEPGSLRAAWHDGLSVHELHLLDAWEETRLLQRAPRKLIVLGVQVGDTSARIGLSPAVERAVPQALVMALRALRVTAAASPHPRSGIRHPQSATRSRENRP